MGLNPDMTKEQAIQRAKFTLKFCIITVIVIEIIVYILGKWSEDEKAGNGPLT
jgi:hypothetical protein